MKKENMVCENCRFKFESEDYLGLRCARLAPREIYSRRVGESTYPEPYCGVPVSRQFYCFQGEWYDEKRGNFFSRWDF